MINNHNIQVISAALLLLIILSSMVNFRSLSKSVREHIGKFKPVHWAWVILFLGIINLGKIQSDDFVLANSVQLFMIIPAAIIIFLSFIIRIKAIPRLNVAIYCLIIYGIMGIVSGFYSPFPALSAYKACLVLLSALACITVMTYKPSFNSVHSLINLTYLFYFVLLISFIAGAVIAPHQVMIEKPGMMLGMLQGTIVRTNPNTVGFVSGLLAILFVNRLWTKTGMKEKIFFMVCAFSSLVVLLLAQSRTCLVAFLCSLLFILLFRKKFLVMTTLIFLVISIWTFHDLTAYKEYGVQYIKRGQTEQSFESWSGRKAAWAYGWEKFKEKPILGYGMAAGVRFGAIGKGFSGSHLHSSYFEVLVNSGLLGFIPWFLTLVLVTKTIIYKTLFPPRWFTDKLKSYHLEMAAILIFGLVRSIAGTTFVYFDHSFMLYIGIIAYASLLIQNEPFDLDEKW